MTATAVPQSAPGAARSWRPPTIVDTLRAEWTKFRTVRSSFWSLLVATVLVVGLGALISLAASHHYSQRSLSDQLGWDPTAVSLAGLTIGQLALAVLGILFVTSEYSTGMIRISLAAVPHRSRLLGAKLAVFTLVALVAGEILGFVSFLLGQAIIHGHAPSASFHQPQILRAVIGSGLYVALLAVIAVGIGTILRNAAAAIATVVALLFVLPGVAQALPSSWRNPVTEYWPTQAGSQILQIHRDAHTLAPWAGFGVMAIFAAVVLAAAFALINRRDA